jgi:hypothetical protein
MLATTEVVAKGSKKIGALELCNIRDSIDSMALGDFNDVFYDLTGQASSRTNWNADKKALRTLLTSEIEKKGPMRSRRGKP